ncbi:MAG: hypothetical protein IH620_07365, partial [Ignavibacterium sp.]|nr:hypothetical protein [Ignavibacterium sp.]
MIPPVNNLTLTNTTLSGTYQAQNQITAETNVSVTGTATLEAGNTINLKPGFTATSGCNLTISVGTVTSDKYYYLKDHLGSIRVVVDTVGEIISYDDYDAWGMILNGRSSNYGFADDKYKFTEKERDTETNYDYFGARYYDSDLGRWLSVDPMADKYPGWSPYNYTMNNPLKFDDPNGKYVRRIIDGKIIFTRQSYLDAFTHALDFIPVVSLGSMGGRSIVGDPSLGVPNGIDYLLNGVGGGLFVKTAAFGYQTYTSFTTIGDVSTALLIDESIFKEMINEQINGISLVSYGVNDRQLEINPELINFYGNQEIAANVIERRIKDKWQIKNPELYKKLYSSSKVQKNNSNPFIPDNTRVY